MGQILTWCLRLVARLNLLLQDNRVGDDVLYMIVTTAVLFDLTTAILSLVAVSMSRHFFESSYDVS